AYAQAEMAKVDAVGVDEKHIGHGRCITVVHDGSAATRGRVLHVSEGRKAENVGAFVEALQAHGGNAQAIARCTLDMGQSYIAGARAYLPHAKICFDPSRILINSVQQSGPSMLISV
ncbi:MAG: transposase, partial [Chloroflexota bacterium]